MFTKKREKGFTLVELLVVITIMGVLGTLLVTNYTKYVDKSKQVVVDEQLTEVIKTFEIAIMENIAIFPFPRKLIFSNPSFKSTWFIKP